MGNTIGETRNQKLTQNTGDTMKITNNSPIGIFDSGVGGLTVARTIMEQLPGESITYIGDTAHSPYGPLPIAEVRKHALRIADELVERYDVPVIEVIHPAVRRAVATTRNGRIGVIGTSGTINSGAYQDLFSVNPNVEITAQACPRFVDFVERGITSGRQILGVAQAYIEPLQTAGVDTLVLGCTHYPLLSGVIQLAIGDNVTLVSSAEETAKDVLKQLSTTDMLADESTTPTHHFESTGDPELFSQLAKRFLGPHVTHVEKLEPM